MKVFCSLTLIWPLLGWDYFYVKKHWTKNCVCGEKMTNRRYEKASIQLKWLDMTEDDWWVACTCSRHTWEWGRPGGSPEALLWTLPGDNMVIIITIIQSRPKNIKVPGSVSAPLCCCSEQPREGYSSLQSWHHYHYQVRLKKKQERKSGLVCSGCHIWYPWTRCFSKI